MYFGSISDVLEKWIDTKRDFQNDFTLVTQLSQFLYTHERYACLYKVRQSIDNIGKQVKIIKNVEKIKNIYIIK